MHRGIQPLTVRFGSRAAFSLATTGALLVSGCSLLGGSGGGGDGRIRITDAGFATEISGVRVAGGAGVAAAGTQVTVTPAPAPQLPSAVAASAGVDIGFDNPPTQPFTVEWAIPTGLEPDSIAFVSTPTEQTSWTGTPVTATSDRATVAMERAGHALFIDGSGLTNGFSQGVREFRAKEYAGPADCATSARVGYAEFSVTNAPEAPLQICLRAEEDELIATLTSRSPHVLTIVPAAGGRLDGGAPADPVSTLLQATVKAQPRGEERGVLAPGATLTLRTRPATGDQDLFTAEADPGLSLIPAAWNGLGSALTAWESSIPESLATDPELASCLSEAVQDAAGEHTATGAPSAKMIACLSTALGSDPERQLPAAVIDSLAAKLTTLLADYAATVRDTAPAHAVATRKVASVDNLADYRLEATGLGPIRIGMSKSEIFANGWGREFPECNTWVAATRIERQNVFLGAYQSGLGEIVVRNPRIRTASGATVGMSVAQLRAIYGDRLRRDVRPTSGGETPIYSVRSGANEIIFWIDSEQPTRVAQMLARPYEPGLYGGC